MEEQNFQIVKISNGVPSAPIVKYEKDGIRITLIGIFHIASKKYFKTIQKEVESHKAGLYEKLIPKDPDFYNKSENQKLINLLSRYRKLHEKIAEQSNLEMQNNCLQVPESWDIADIHLEDFLENPEHFEKLISTYDNTERLSKKSTVKETRDFLSEKFTTETGEEWQEVILHKRNDILIKKLEEKILKENDIGILYGITHLTGIDSVIIDRGFKRIDTKWIPRW